ncbi:MAG TPA: S66 peptidase family protein [Thermoanaerobaculia bacterium]|nr:S66 peptidase family protein [Thermoanaerobaculia bacterium]
MTVSLSWGGPARYPDVYERGVAALSSVFGLEVVAAPRVFEPSADPLSRAADLMTAFADPSVRGIITTIGGEDSIRLLPYLDPAVIAANPKIFLGYSDTTVSHFFCFNAGLTTFYGPSVMAGFAELLPYTEAAVRRALLSTSPIGVLQPAEGWTPEWPDWESFTPRALRPRHGWTFLQGSGIAEGRLLGGCIDVMEFVRGTSAWPASFDGAILFLETSEDAPPPLFVTRALRSYAAMGILHQIRGLIFGRPGGGERFEEYDAAILQVVRDEEGLAELPIITGMDFGHTDPMFVLPYGALARIDCERRTFAVLESGVID